MSSEEARRLDILLDLRKKGYNLKDGDKPEIVTMSLGGGYTLECNVKNPSKEWKILFDDGIEVTEYPVKSEKVVHTYRKDSDALIDEYDSVLGTIKTPAVSKGEHTTAQNKKKSFTGKNSCHAVKQERVGMAFPIVYPSEMIGSYMRFKQWTAQNNVIPADSEVILLEENEYNYRVSIPKAHISFDIQKDKAEIIGSEGAKA